MISNTYCVQCIVLNILSSDGSSFTADVWDIYFYPIFTTEKNSLGEGKGCAQGHAAC